MKRYDLAFSLGAACSCSQSLREAGLQFASYPLDWVCSPGVCASVDVLLSDPSEWFATADLKLFDVRREPLSCRVYRNVRTGFLSVHDFPLSECFETSYPRTLAKYRRRTRRLVEALEAGGAVLAVYIEMPFRTTEPDNDYAYARKRLQERFPDCAVDILVFRNRIGLTLPEVREIVPGVDVVELDIQIMEGGEISHQTNRSRIVQWLGEHVSVVDRRTADDILAYEKGVKRAREAKWRTGNVIVRRMRQLTYKLFRWLERYLVGQGLVPRERPFRF